MSNINEALLKFQNRCPVIGKDADNPYFKSKYAPLDAIWSVIRPILNECGLTVIQPVRGNSVMTTVIHAESGEKIESEFPIVAKDSSNPQSIGSAVTYARRYSLCSLLSIQTGDDDDGNSASPSPEIKKASDKQLDYIRKIIDAMPDDLKANAYVYIKEETGNKLPELSSDQASKMIEDLKEWRKQ